MSDFMGIIWLVVLLGVNAFFVAAEFAVLAARRAQIEPLAEAGNRAAKQALWAMEHATLMLATCQLGITVASIVILNVAEPAIHNLLAKPLALLGLGAATVPTVSFVIALVIVSFLHVTLGEMVPKNWSFSVPDRAVLLLAPPLVAISKVFRPLIALLDHTANGVLRLFGVEPKSEANAAFTLDQVATIVEQSKREGMLSDDSGTLTKAFSFSSKTAAELLIVPSALITLPLSASPSDVEDAVREHGFSRFLLTQRGKIGEPYLGYVHIKDVLDVSDDEFDAPLPVTAIRPLERVEANASVDDTLTRMRSSGTHLAIVTDGVRELGVVFLEDLVEELVGEVEDATWS